MKKLLLITIFFASFVSGEVLFELGLQEMKGICNVSFSSMIVAENCVTQLIEACRSNIIFDMFDASSKFPYPGIAISTRADYGIFDQCVDIYHEYSQGRILGKHCYPGLLLPDFSNLSNTDPSSLYKLSICMPDACSAEDYNTIFQEIFLKHFPGVFIDANCATKENEDLKAIDIATLSILFCCLSLIVAATTYDVYLHKSNTKCRHPLMIAFSVYTNSLKILQTSGGNKEQISIFHGMKSISMLWIIAGHGFVAWNNMIIINDPDITKFKKDLYIFYVTAAPLAVDTFFYIGGFLLAYQYMKIKAKPLRDHLQAVPQMIIHRYLRLTPAVVMLYLVYLSIFPRIGSGPMWNAGIKKATDLCYNVPAWTFFLYIQNYYSYPDEPCIVHTWYLSADMQMFLLSPLIIIPVAIMLQDEKKLGKCMLSLLGLNVFLTALPLVIKLVFRDYNNNYDTHSRLVVYFIGLMMGVFMREQQNKPFLYNKVKHKSIVNLAMWFFSIVGMLVTTICYQEVERNEGYESRVVFYSLMRPAWCIGLSWMVYSSYHGYGGIVSWFLSRPIFQILGKLSYCMYLVHGLIVVYSVLTIRSKLYFSDLSEFYRWCSYVILSVIMSFIWTLAFESPLMIIEKHVMNLGRRKGKSSGTA